MALVAYNVLKVVVAALAAGQRGRKTQEELPSYHLATEMSAFSERLAVAVPAEKWQHFVAMTTAQFVTCLREIAEGLDYSRYRKNKRGPK